VIRLKPGASLDNVHPRIYFAIAMAAPVWARYGSPDLVVTAGNEAGHETNPDPKRQFHRLPDGTCQAGDLRTWTIPVLEHRHAACKELAGILGPDYDVLYERPGLKGEHCHVQLDPERPGTR
jgi:hypothetical protein